MEINLIIRELLAKYDFISLPGIGSFTQRYEPAFPSSDGKSFIPPKQVISFDTTRDFNDEAIENYLCEKLGISHSEASDQLKVFIARLNYDLDNGRSRIFENVGELFKNKKGKIRFDSAPAIEAALSTYGLNSIEVEIASPKKPGKAKVKIVPVKKEGSSVERKSSTKTLLIISILTIIAAAIATFILIPDFRFWERNLNINKTLAESKTNSGQNQLNPEISAPRKDSTITKKDSVEAKIEQNIIDNNDKKTALYYEEPKIQTSKTYYLIVGSFGKIENAQKLTETYKQKGFNPEIVQGNNTFRVSISKSTNKEKALSDYNKYKTDNPTESVWILAL